jgi:hypothetical protein
MLSPYVCLDSRLFHAFCFRLLLLACHVILCCDQVMFSYVLRLRLSYVRVMFQDTFQDLRRNRRALGGLSRRALG